MNYFKNVSIILKIDLNEGQNTKLDISKIFMNRQITLKILQIYEIIE